MPRFEFSGYRRLVIKVGSSLLVDGGGDLERALVAVAHDAREPFRVDDAGADDAADLLVERADHRTLGPGMVVVVDRAGCALQVLDRSRGARVAVDREQMGQLLLNLAQNAVSAAVEEEDGRPEVRLTARREGPELVLEVEDNGPGIPPEEQEKVFELFYSTRKGGTGLGLAITYNIVRRHGGEIRAENHADAAGCSFTIDLPRPDCI